MLKLGFGMILLARWGNGGIGGDLRHLEICKLLGLSDTPPCVLDFIPQRLRNFVTAHKYLLCTCVPLTEALVFKVEHHDHCLIQVNHPKW